MMSTDTSKLIEGMPKAENPFESRIKELELVVVPPEEVNKHVGELRYCYMAKDIWNTSREAQCKLAVEQEYRKVPNKLPDNWHDILRQRTCTNCRDREANCYPCSITDWSTDGAKTILLWLLEGDSAEKTI